MNCVIIIITIHNGYCNYYNKSINLFMHFQGCQKAPVTFDITSYFASFADYNIIVVSETSKVAG